MHHNTNGQSHPADKLLPPEAIGRPDARLREFLLARKCPARFLSGLGRFARRVIKKRHTRKSRRYLKRLLQAELVS